MSERTQRRRRFKAPSGRLVAELAVLGVLLLHVAFFYLFRVQSGGGREVPADTIPDCVFVSPLADAAAWEKELRAWCFLADPSLFTLPDEERGFSSVRETEHTLPMTEPPVFQPALKLAEERPFPQILLAPGLPPFDREISEKWTYARPPLPEVPPTVRLPQGVFWRFTDGTRLTDLPAPDNAEARKTTSEGGAPTASTLLEISFASSLPRVLVRRSCGNRLLDQMAVRELRKAVLKREEVALQNGPAVSWFPAAGQRSAFEVEWRLLPTETAAGTGAEKAGKP